MGKKLKAPPAGLSRPKAAGDLRAALIANSPAARAGLVDIVVLDLAR